MDNHKTYRSIEPGTPKTSGNAIQLRAFFAGAGWEWWGDPFSVYAYDTPCMAERAGRNLYGQSLCLAWEVWQGTEKLACYYPDNFAAFESGPPDDLPDNYQPANIRFDEKQG